jgi:DNA-binding CsgD family transcriptional regulator
MFVPEDDTSMVSRESADRFYSLALVLDEINEGVTLLNEEAQLLWRNRAFDKLLVENREGHMLVAVILDFAGEFYRELQIDPTMETFKAYIINVGRVEHEMYFSLLPKGMLGQESFLLCVVKRLSSEWSNYEEQMRQNWSLTKREAQVAVECLRGKKNLEIASSLKISVSAVNKHLEKIYQKAGVRGRSELASRWIEDFK